MDTNYYGQDIDLRGCALQSMKIDKAHCEDEAGLVQTRWFDYSLMHPTQATYLYAYLYRVQTRKFCEAYIDIRTAEDAVAFIPEDIFLSRDMTSMWLARRCADALGLPYEFALQFAGERALVRTFQHFPRPNQLYGEEFELDLAAAWAESLSRSLRYSRLPRYAADAPANEMHRRHARFVIAQIKGRAGPHTALLARTFHENILSPSMALNHFTEAQVNKALAQSLCLSGQS